MSQYVKDLLSSCFVTQEMYNRGVGKTPWMLRFVPDQYKTQKICNEAVGERPLMLGYVPDQYKTQEMCIEAVKKIP